MSRTNLLLAFALIAALLPGSLARAEPPASVAVYIGSYTGPDEAGIHLMRLDLATGGLSAPAVVAKTVNPTFLALHPTGKFLYAINEIVKYQDKPAGSVSGFKIDPETGGLTPINVETSGGTGPCFISIDPTGKWTLVANYGGGSVETLPVDEAGRLGTPSCFIQHAGLSPSGAAIQPHAHCIQLDPSQRFALANDLGLDEIKVYKFDAATGALRPNNPPAAQTAKGAGPRHCAFHPNGKWVYDINELNSTLSAYAWDATRGVLTELQTVSTLPADFKGKSSCAEVAVHPNGKFVFGSNRGDDSIVAFSVDPATGKLTFVGRAPTGGKTPRDFALDPSGRWLLAANQDSGNVVVFKVDPETGKLEPTGHEVKVHSPVCVTFAPSVGAAAGKP